MRRALLLSLLLHGLVAIALLVGVPRPPVLSGDTVVAVEIVSETATAEPGQAAPEPEAERETAEPADAAPLPERQAAAPPPEASVPPPAPAPEPEPEPREASPPPPEPEPVQTAAGPAPPEPEPVAETPTPEAAPRPVPPPPPRPETEPQKVEAPPSAPAAPAPPKLALRPSPRPSPPRAEPVASEPPAQKAAEKPSQRADVTERDSLDTLLRSVERLDARRRAERERDANGREPAADTGSAGARSGAADQRAVLIGLQRMVEDQVYRCWIVPIGAKGISEVRVVLRFRLAPDGSLQGMEVVDRARLSRDPVFRVVAESAVRAVQRCAPLRLPADQYALWRDVEMSFDPTRALGG